MTATPTMVVQAVILLLLSFSPKATAFATGQRLLVHQQCRNRWIPTTVQLSKESQEEETNQGDEDNNGMPIIDTSTVRIDDGGSDLTDRFKYKVNALMGAYDPSDASADTEHNNGNILNAILKFPVVYTFNVVGKTQEPDETTEEKSQKDTFVELVQAVVSQETGEDQVSLRITPRGKRFTKVTVSVEVQTAEMIASIYKGLENIELSVMQF